MTKARKEQPCQSAVSARPQVSRRTAVALTCSDHLEDAAIYLASAQLSIARASGQMNESDKRMLGRINSDIRLDRCALESMRRIQLSQEQQLAAETAYLLRVCPRNSVRMENVVEEPRAEVLP